MAGPFLKVRTEKQGAVIQVQPHTVLRVFIGDESLGWSATGPQTGVAISATCSSPVVGGGRLTLVHRPGDVRNASLPNVRSFL